MAFDFRGPFRDCRDGSKRRYCKPSQPVVGKDYMEALRVEGLSKEFGGLVAVNRITMHVNEGEHLALIGPNGAGKSTLFNLLGGQLRPSSGMVLFEGKDITGLSPNQRTHIGIARTFQILNLLKELTVIENMLLALQGTKSSRFQLIRPMKRYRKLFSHAETLLGPIGLWHRRNDIVRTLSYGEQRKLEIVLSLASKPKLLLLDEPSCGLTAAESSDITEAINQLEQGITVMFVAHDMDLVFGVAQRIIVLHYGNIIAEGHPDEIQNDPKVREIYMGSVKYGNLRAT
jgi:branched-chain amino acid transport system ATP-binding protein